MSSTIRSVLSVAIPRARQNITNATQLLTTQSDDLTALSSASEVLTKNMELIEKHLDKWTLVIGGLKADALIAEEATFNQYNPGGDTPGEIIVILNETIAQLDLRVDQVHVQRQPAPPVNAAIPQQLPIVQPPIVPLPTMGLLDFDGNPAKWGSFWSNFRDNVDRRMELSPAQKLSYLFGQLRGTAKDIVMGYPNTDASYDIVKQALAARFGDEFKRANDLRAELIRLPKATATTTSLRTLSESVERICRQLNSLEANMDESPYVVTTLLEKIPAEIKFELMKQERDSGAKWTAKLWREGLVSTVQLREAAKIDRESSSQRQTVHGEPQIPARINGQNRPFWNQPRRAFPMVKPVNGGFRNPTPPPFKPPQICSLCENGAHLPTKCPRFSNAKKRRQKLTEQGRCFVCIKSGHSAPNCTSQLKCKECGGRHHIMICNKFRGEFLAPAKQVNGTVRFSTENLNGHRQGHTASAPVAATAMACPGKRRNPSFLMVINVHVHNHRKPINPALVPIFWDQGSQNSFITTPLVHEIKPPRISTEDMVVGGFVGNQKETFSSFRSPCYLVMIEREDGGWEQVMLNQTDKITSAIECLMVPDGLNDSEGQNYQENPSPSISEPQILIGVREFWRFILDWTEIRPGIFKIQTVFGPVYGGEEMGITPLIQNRSLTCMANSPAQQDGQEIKNFWALESIGIMDCPEMNDDEKAVQKFDQSIKTDQEGRYEVSLPWKSESERPPENFKLAFSRLAALVRKLKDSPQLFKGCDDIIQDYVARGIIEMATRTTEQQHFLPHHTVMGKKLRIVFDASSHEKGARSLNDTLFSGPNLYPDLAGKLIQFRATKFPIWADIEKAFLMISLKESDREFSKFLWVKDIRAPLSGKNLIVFRFKRITFGIVSCPFLLAATLKHHLDTHPSSLAREMVENSLLYVDNLLLLADTPNEARNKAVEAQTIFAAAKMRLCEFIAADQISLVGIPEKDRLETETPNVLGLKWVINKDHLSLSFPTVPGPEGLTRRVVLKTIASFFDPLGLCSPCLVGPKIFFQKLWNESQGWDDLIPISECTEWIKIQNHWDSEILSIPRHTRRVGSNSLQLHAFSDASPDAFACTVYIRAEMQNENVVSMVYSRSRIRPKKMATSQSDGLTIPRLELLGILIGTRAIKFVKRHLNYNIEKCFLWSDSRIALSWLASNEKMPIFVANRVREIRSNRLITFSYVRSADNPADLATRQTSPAELRNAILWWNGPEWLSKSNEFWPEEYTVQLPPEESISPGPIVSAALATMPTILDFARFSSWRKLLGTAMYVLRFLSIMGEKRKLFTEFRGESFLSPENKEKARIWILKIAQRAISPPKETYLDKTGLLRLKSRLCGTGNVDFEHPVIIPSDSWICTLLIRHSHLSLCHAGIDSTLTAFLANYWCKRARRTVRSVILACNVCKKDRAVTFGLPSMPPLPQTRTRPSAVFENIGIDFLGPTLYKIPNDQPAKSWVLLITCLACRAVHLELVSSMAAEHFLLAFRRFVARRGLPKSILSDHGSQFMLAKALFERNAEYSIKWNLIPAFSPWSGGVYERLNSLIKNCFRRVLGRRLLCWEEINTFLAEAEASINSRPITFVSDETDGPLPLRPMDFIAPRAILTFEEPDMEEEIYRPSAAEKLAARWWATAKSIRNFWERWSNEYLLILRERNQTKHKGPRLIAHVQPKIGHIVLVEHSEYPRNTWPMGRVVELKGPEGHPRSANIKMPNGNIWSRPVSKLVPLEVPPDEESENQSLSAGGDFQGENLGPDEVSIPDQAAGKENGDVEHPSEDEPIRPKSKFKWAKQPPGRFNFKWAERPPRVSIAASSPLLLVMMIILAFQAEETSANNQTSWLKCNLKGVKIEAPEGAQNVELCCDGICGSRNYIKPFIFPLIEESLLSGFTCMATFWVPPNTSLQQTAECAPIDVCTLLDCYLCEGRILNPHCSPMISAFLIGILMLLGGIFLCMLCCLFRWSRWFCGGIRALCRCVLIRRKAKKLKYARLRRVASDGSSDVEDYKPQKAYRGRSFKPLTKLGYALAILIFFGVPFSFGEPASITANTEECKTDSVGTKCRINSVTLLNLLPAGQPVDLIVRTTKSAILGTLTFKLKGLAQECVPESLGFIRSYQIRTLASKRCPGMGSCTDKTCENLLPNGTVPELAEGNVFPGNSFCLDSSSFWFHGCGGTNSACLFYRNYAVPSSNEERTVYEMFRCPAWQFRVKTEIKVNFAGGLVIKEETDFYSGRTFHLKGANLSVTPAVFGNPAAPIMSEIFFGGWDKAVLVRNVEPALHCQDELSASLMKCKLSLDACTKCRPDHNEGIVRCHCREIDVERWLEEPSKRLPLSVGPLTLNYRQPRQVWAESEYVPVQMVIKMEGLTLSVRRDMATCHITPGDLTGCYRCRTGSRFKFKCEASLGNPLAEILCDNGARWVTHCPEGSTDKNISLSLNDGDVDTICVVRCPGGVSNFTMKGTLHYLPSAKMEWRISGKKTEFGSEWPDFSLMSNVFRIFNWVLGGPQFFVVLGIFFAGILILYLFVKCNPVLRGYRRLIRLITLIIIFLITLPFSECVKTAEESTTDHLWSKLKIVIVQFKGELAWGTFFVLLAANIWAVIIILKEWSKRHGLLQINPFRHDRIQPLGGRIVPGFRH